ncbi:MAG TPA: alpha/beta fold hydrolase, partial [Desulfosarcina sp.]|nr:alpha/beta fold hydrolase [Desulfosarcina sp.]
MKFAMRMFRRIAGIGLGIIWISGCASSNLAYTPSDMAVMSRSPSLTEIRFETRAGRQSAFYLPPRNDPEALPSPLVIAYPGIGSRALDWRDLVSAAPDVDAGFLLIDYPGRGHSEGWMRPKYLPESTRGALESLGRYLDAPTSRLTARLVLLGHSFGCGAALQVATELGPERIVLIAPFTTLGKALFLKIGPLAWFNPDRMDNRERIQEVCNLTPRPVVTLIHGDSDGSIPVEMARELAGLTPGCVAYREISGAGHMDVLETARDLIFEGV